VLVGRVPSRPGNNPRSGLGGIVEWLYPAGCRCMSWLVPRSAWYEHRLWRKTAGREPIRAFSTGGLAPAHNRHRGVTRPRWTFCGLYARPKECEWWCDVKALLDLDPARAAASVCGRRAASNSAPACRGGPPSRGVHRTAHVLAAALSEPPWLVQRYGLCREWRRPAAFAFVSARASWSRTTRPVSAARGAPWKERGLRNRLAGRGGRRGGRKP